MYLSESLRFKRINERNVAYKRVTFSFLCGCYSSVPWDIVISSPCQNIFGVTMVTAFISREYTIYFYVFLIKAHETNFLNCILSFFTIDIFSILDIFLTILSCINFFVNLQIQVLVWQVASISYLRSFLPLIFKSQQIVFFIRHISKPTEYFLPCFNIYYHILWWSLLLQYIYENFQINPVRIESLIPMPIV
jgi:hypothetical protein